MDDLFLKELYLEYNERYFDSTLPQLRIAFSNKMPTTPNATHSALGAFYRRQDKILINDKIRGWNNTVRLVLLHEMVHVQTPDNLAHDDDFYERQIRLVLKGQ